MRAICEMEEEEERENIAPGGYLSAAVRRGVDVTTGLGDARTISASSRSLVQLSDIFLQAPALPANTRMQAPAFPVLFRISMQAPEFVCRLPNSYAGARIPMQAPEFLCKFPNSYAGARIPMQAPEFLCRLPISYAGARVPMQAPEFQCSPFCGHVRCHFPPVLPSV
jgi:hypothetical protein